MYTKYVNIVLVHALLHLRIVLFARHAANSQQNRKKCIYVNQLKYANEMQIICKLPRVPLIPPHPSVPTAVCTECTLRPCPHSN